MEGRIWQRGASKGPKDTENAKQMFINDKQDKKQD
jgi:hypothetical protein